MSIDVFEVDARVEDTLVASEGEVALKFVGVIVVVRDLVLVKVAASGLEVVVVLLGIVVAVAGGGGERGAEGIDLPGVVEGGVDVARLVDTVGVARVGAFDAVIGDGGLGVAELALVVPVALADGGEDTEGVVVGKAVVELRADVDTLSSVARVAVLVDDGGDVARGVVEFTFGVVVVASVVVVVGGVEGSVPTLDIEVESRTDFAAYAVAVRIVAKRRCDAAIDARLAVLLEDDVDDAAGAFGRVFGTRVGDDFDAFDVLRRHLFKDLGTVLLVKSRGFAVDPDFDVAVVA